MILIPIGTDAPLKRRPVVNYAIIAINVAAYLLFNVLAQRFRLSELIALKRDMMLWPGSPTIWQFLTYQFLHADILHLLGNMWFLWLFGNPTNSKMGDLPYLLFYLAGGVFAGFGFALTETELPCLGASGSIAAVTTAYLVFFPRSVVRMFYWIFWFIGDFHVGSMPLIIGKMILWDNIVAMRLQSGGLVTVAYEAHLAGYAFGFLGGLLLLLIHAIERDPFDILSLWSRWRRRRQFAAAVAEGRAGSPYDLPAGQHEQVPLPVARPATGSVEHRALEIKGAISKAIDRFDLPEAARLYKQLLELDPQQILPRGQQLDVANQLTSQGEYALAVEAYEKFLQRYPGGDEATQVRFLLGVICARHLGDYEKAEQYLVACQQSLRDEKQIAQCKYWLEVVRRSRTDRQGEAQ